jgi:hypothetical protein
MRGQGSFLDASTCALMGDIDFFYEWIPVLSKIILL